MFFGFRLPGPFRIGVSSKGRVYGGVNLGPFSVSGQLANLSGGKGQRRHTTPPTGPKVWPYTLEEVVSAAEDDGWTVTSSKPYVVKLSKGNNRVLIRAVQGGVIVVRLMSYLSMFALAALLSAGVFAWLLWCAGAIAGVL